MKIQKLKNIIFLALLFLLTSCAIGAKKYTQPPEGISVMAYNLENLFDTQHDKGTEDHSYLPLKSKQTAEHKKICMKIRHGKYKDECLNMDWSESVLKRKMERLAKVVLQVNGGKGPDILIMEEIENMNVLTLFNDNHLKPAKYKTKVLIEGFDKRGIDVAVLSRLEQFQPATLHKIPYKASKPEDQEWMDRSRGILQVNLLLPDKTPLVVYGVHFPSGANPTYWRKQSVDHLNHLLKKVPNGTLAIAGGDFNINSEEDSKHNLYEKDLGQHWLVSHIMGCGECVGTNYYHTKRQWSFLDALLFHKDMHPTEGKSNWILDAKSIAVPESVVYQKNRFMSPARFDENSPVGVSDHWPVFAVIKPRPKKVSSSPSSSSPAPSLEK